MSIQNLVSQPKFRKKTRRKPRTLVNQVWPRIKIEGKKVAVQATENGKWKVLTTKQARRFVDRLYRYVEYVEFST